MDTPSLEDLAGRLTSLERENRWLKRVGGASIVGFLALIAVGTGAFRSPREITAERFVLNDAFGHARARLELRPDGPALSLLAPDRSDQVLLQALNNGPSTLRYHHGSELRTSLSDYPGIGPSLTLFDHNRHSKAEFYVRDQGDSGLTLHRYQRGVGLNLETDGTSKLSFLDHQGAERAGMALGVDGRTLGLGVPAGESVAKPACDPEKSPAEKPNRGGVLSGRAFGAP
jgi:hypothetical protein